MVGDVSFAMDMPLSALRAGDTAERSAIRDLTSAAPVFSFVHDGKHSTELLASWKRTKTKRTAENGKEVHVITYADPVMDLQVQCEVTYFSNFPAVEWVLRIHNAGSSDTPILEDIRPLDLQVSAPSEGEIVLHHSYGSTCEPTDFLPSDESIPPNAEIMISPHGGRSSNGALPFLSGTAAGSSGRSDGPGNGFFAFIETRIAI